ncbi:protein KRI1 homolog [Punica granatum]|uniref:Protein KRI1 homolog n=1 Tax=Punica granatum TaxID=22663 RepID=A0A218WJT7_PUNGR|nr:protein KRI1 homolog [Punica granatum]OWM72302.1 hypothetical protein CDL15_Pgr018187 [Punica granatum]
MGLKLFDGGDPDADDISKIEINQEYARRFEHNKKREDLHRLQELQQKGVIGDSSSSLDSEDSSSSYEESDDADETGPSKGDLEFFDALIKVKKQDPSLKQKDVTLFKSDGESESEDDGKEGRGESKQKRKMYLKDVVAKQLIEGGPEFDDDDEQGGCVRKKTYNEEQEELKRAFLEAAEAAESDVGDGDFLTVKKRDEGVEGGHGETAEFQKKLNEYFGEDEGLDEHKMFLRDYFLKKMWIDKDKKKEKGRADEEELDELLQDEEEVEKQEDYETNYRHEEVEDDRVLGHSRNVEGSVRLKETARKRQRQRKEERMKIAEMERKEELKHLKNLKKEEIKEKLQKFKQISGIADDNDCLLLGDDLDDEFDPEEYDRMMKKVFDEKYYEAEDLDPDFGSDRDEDGDIEKPDFEKEDELLRLPKGWDVPGSGDGFLAARERMLKQNAEAGDDGGSAGGSGTSEDDKDEGRDDDGSEDGGSGASEDGKDEGGDDGNNGGDGETGASEEGKRKRKRKLSLIKRAKEALMEEYYNLDYEDTIGDLKTRFKYAKIKPNRYGLSTAEILMMDDKELNQYVSLKKIAPFREKEWKVPNSQRYHLKMKKKELLKEGPSKRHKSDKRKRPRDDAGPSAPLTDAGEDGKAPVNMPDGDMSNLSRKARRRRHQAELKLSHQRLLAYGKVSSKSKGKSKK